MLPCAFFGCFLLIIIVLSSLAGFTILNSVDVSDKEPSSDDKAKKLELQFNDRVLSISQNVESDSGDVLEKMNELSEIFIQFCQSLHSSRSDPDEQSQWWKLKMNQSQKLSAAMKTLCEQVNEPEYVVKIMGNLFSALTQVYESYIPVHFDIWSKMIRNHIDQILELMSPLVTLVKSSDDAVSIMTELFMFAEQCKKSSHYTVSEILDKVKQKHIRLICYLFEPLENCINTSDHAALMMMELSDRLYWYDLESDELNVILSMMQRLAFKWEDSNEATILAIKSLLMNVWNVDSTQFEPLFKIMLTLSKNIKTYDPKQCLEKKMLRLVKYKSNLHVTHVDIIVAFVKQWISNVNTSEHATFAIEQLSGFTIWKFSLQNQVTILDMMKQLIEKVNNSEHATVVIDKVICFAIQAGLKPEQGHQILSMITSLLHLVDNSENAKAVKANLYLIINWPPLHFAQETKDDFYVFINNFVLRFPDLDA